MSAPHQPDTPAAAAAAYRKAALDGLVRLLDDLFDGADAELRALADAADMNADPRLYPRAARALREQRGHITAHYLDTMGQALARGVDGPPALPEALDLEAMDPQEIEEAEAVANAVYMADAQRDAAWKALAARLAGLAADQTLAADGASPGAIGHAFQQALHSTGCDLALRLLAYRLLGRTLTSGLAPLYRRLDALLAQRGVAAGTHAPPATASAEGRRQGERARRRTQQLTALRRGIAPEGQFGIREIHGALEAVAGGTTPLAPLARRATALLRARQTDPAPRSLPPATARTLDAAARLFDDFADDADSTPAFQAWLRRLRLPLLQAALLDPDLFAAPGQHGRRLLNRLAVLNPCGHKPEAGAAGALIERLAGGLADDPAVFDEVDTALDALLRQRLEQAPERLRIATAKRMVVLELRQQNLGKHTPAGAKAFLLKGWGPLLAWAYLAGEPARWDEASTVLAQAVAAWQPAAGTARAAAQAGLVEESQRVLRQAGFLGRARIGDAVAALQGAFAAANRGAAATLDAWDPDEPVFDDSGSADASFDRILAAAPPPRAATRPSSAPTGSVSAARLINRACTRGTWLQVHTRDGMRWLKFDRLDGKRAIVYFCNRSGEDVFARDAGQFADELLRGLSRPIYDTAAFERKLTAVLGERQG